MYIICYVHKSQIFPLLHVDLFEAEHRPADVVNVCYKPLNHFICSHITS